jgi:cytidyltransferase-like protein
MEIIYIPGSFDLFHVGHIRIFQYAFNKFKHSFIIVGVSDDNLIMSYKNIKPIYPLNERIETVKSCRYVNKVIVQRKFFDVKQLKPLKINYILLGDDWKNKKFTELALAQKKLGFKIIYKPYTKEVSSSEIKKRIIKNAYEIIEAQTKRKSC